MSSTIRLKTSAIIFVSGQMSEIICIFGVSLVSDSVLGVLEGEQRADLQLL